MSRETAFLYNERILLTFKAPANVSRRLLVKSSASPGGLLLFDVSHQETPSRSPNASCKRIFATPTEGSLAVKGEVDVGKEAFAANRSRRSHFRKPAAASGREAEARRS